MTAGAQPLQADTPLVPALAVQALPLDDEVVVFDPLRNKLYRFNRTGAFIWRRIEKRTTMVDLAQQVRSQYDLTERVASDVVEQFVRNLLSLGIVGNEPDGESDYQSDQPRRRSRNQRKEAK